MTLLLAILSLMIFRLGMFTSVDGDGRVQVSSPGLAGCGMAAFLGVVTAWVFA